MNTSYNLLHVYSFIWTVKWGSGHKLLTSAKWEHMHHRNIEGKWMALKKPTMTNVTVTFIQIHTFEHATYKTHNPLACVRYSNVLSRWIPTEPGDCLKKEIANVVNVTTHTTRGAGIHHTSTQRHPEGGITHEDMNMQCPNMYKPLRTNTTAILNAFTWGNDVILTCQLPSLSVVIQMRTHRYRGNFTTHEWSTRADRFHIAETRQHYNENQHKWKNVKCAH